MPRRMPKFPLKMANGANVRNLEDLRTNADIESIVNYYLSGQLSLWCRAFGYDAFPEKLECITFELIKNIYTMLEIPVSEQEIKNYIKENGIHVKNTAANDTETEEEVIDNAEVKKKLKSYVNSGISLSDYAVEVMPVNDDNGKLCKYKIIVSNAKTEQYTSFVLPYDVSGSYTKKKFSDDLYKKIAYIIKKQNEEFGYLKLKNSRYAGLKVGDTFEFGNYEGKSIIWKVITKEKDRLLAISHKTICKMRYGSGRETYWKDSEVNKWLNKKFYSGSFNISEKELISQEMIDKCISYLFVLSDSEVWKYLYPAEEVKSEDAEVYWTRSFDGGTYGMRCVGERGSVDYVCYASATRGVRPAFWLKF